MRMNCKMCNNLIQRTENGYRPNSRDKRFIDGEGHEWNGHVCPSCHKTNVKTDIKHRRLNNSHTKSSYTDHSGKYSWTYETIAKDVGLSFHSFKEWLYTYQKKGAIPRHQNDRSLSKQIGMKTFFTDKFSKIIKEARSKVPKRKNPTSVIQSSKKFIPISINVPEEVYSMFNEKWIQNNFNLFLRETLINKIKEF